MRSLTQEAAHQGNEPARLTTIAQAKPPIVSMAIVANNNVTPDKPSPATKDHPTQKASDYAKKAPNFVAKTVLGPSASTNIPPEKNIVIFKTTTVTEKLMILTAQKIAQNVSAKPSPKNVDVTRLATKSSVSANVLKASRRAKRSTLDCAGVHVAIKSSPPSKYVTAETTTATLKLMITSVASATKATHSSASPTHCALPPKDSVVQASKPVTKRPTAMKDRNAKSKSPPKTMKTAQLLATMTAMASQTRAAPPVKREKHLVLEPVSIQKPTLNTVDNVAKNVVPVNLA